MKRIVVFLSVCLVAMPLTADTVFLEDGKSLVGKILSKDSESVIIETDYGKEEINKKIVNRISYSNTQLFSNQNKETKQSLGGYALDMQQLCDQENVWERETEIVTKVGINSYGSIQEGGWLIVPVGGAESSIYSANNVDVGSFFAGEYLKWYKNNIGLGAGLLYQFPQKREKINGYFNFTALYVMIKIRTQTKSKRIYPYTVAHLGYNELNGDTEFRGAGGKPFGGYYYAIGQGLTIGRSILELLFSENNGLIEYGGNNANGIGQAGKVGVHYYKISLCYGIVF